MNIVETDEFVMPSNSDDRENIRNAIKEAAASMDRIQGERELIKEVFDKIKDQYDIKPKYLRKIARAYHKQNFGEEEQEFQVFENSYRQLFND